MQHKRLKVLVLIFLGLGLTELQAQEAILASGGNASGSGGSASYSVGQVVYMSFTGTTGSMVQGSQQPYEISVVTGLKEITGIDLGLSVFPNPTADVLILKIENNQHSAITASLYDVSGKILETRKPDGLNTSFDMSNMVPGVYFLTVTQNKKETKTFKIIKN